MLDRFTRRFWLFTIILAGLLAPSVRGGFPPLVDHVPSTAVFYVGWAGAYSQSKSYDQSNMKVFIEHSNLPKVAQDLMPGLWEELNAHAGTDANAIATAAATQDLLPLLWRHPVAIYVADLKILDDGSPDAHATLVCDAGTDAPAMESDLQTISKSNPHSHVTNQNSIVTLSVDDTPAGPMASSLAANPGFISAMKPLQDSPAVAVYVDIATILARITDSAEKRDSVHDLWPKVRDALGFTTMKRFAMTGGFDGPDWATACRLEAPGPRTGLLACIEPKPIDPVLLARVPATAGSVSVYNFDAALFVDTIGNAMAVNPDSDKVFHQAMGLATIGLGRNFRRKIVGPLGPQWVTYTDTSTHGAVLLNHPNDADTASDSLVSAAFGLINLANSQLPGARDNPVVTADQKRIKGIDTTAAVTQFAAPAFAVQDSVIYFGSSANSIVTAALLPATAGTTDLLHSTDFMSMQQRIHVPMFSSFGYYDLPRTAPDAVAGFGADTDQLQQLFGAFQIEIPKIELPSLDQIQPHVSPALSASRGDDQGIYYKSIAPFPGSTLLLGNAEQTLSTLKLITTIAGQVQHYFDRH